VSAFDTMRCFWNQSDYYWKQSKYANTTACYSVTVCLHRWLGPRNASKVAHCADNCATCASTHVNGPCLLDYLILKLRLPVVLYVSFAVDSR